MSGGLWLSVSLFALSGYTELREEVVTSIAAATASAEMPAYPPGMLAYPAEMPVQGETSPGKPQVEARPIRPTESMAMVRYASPTGMPAYGLTPTPATWREGPVILVEIGTPRPIAAVSPRQVATPSPVALPVRLYLNGREITVVETGTTPVLVDGRHFRRWLVPRSAAGHHNNTPAFGQPGNVIIAGHSIWYGETGVFAPLLEIEEGDLIVGINDDGQRFTYRVSRVWSSAYDDGSWLAQPADPDVRHLTLYTCNLELTALVVVQAELVD